MLQILEKTHTPGLIGVVVEGRQSTWIGALGIADRNTGRPVTSDSRFRIGSISKTFTSLVALILAQRGELELDVPLQPLIPDAGISNPWQATDPVLLYHALEHTAGFDDIHLRDYAFSDPDVSLRDGIRFNTSSRISRWRPGTRMAYSNIGPALAALAMTRIRAEPFEEIARQDVLDPLGMTATGYFFHPDVVPSYRQDGETPEPYMHIADRPSGAMHATASDMARLLQMFINRGRLGQGALLTPESLQRMEAPVSTLAARAGLVAGYGLGNSGREIEGFWYQGHSGGIDGFLSNFAYIPDAERGYFFAINAANGDAVRQIDRLFRVFITRDLTPPPQTPYLSGVRLDELTGYYQPDAPRQELLRWLELLSGTVAVSTADDALLITPVYGTRSVWRPLTPQLFRSDRGIRPGMAAVTSIEGVQFLQGPELGTLKKIPAPLAWLRLLLAAISVLLIVSAVLFAPVWLTRRLLGTRFELLSLRVWPLAASVSIIAALLALQLGQSAAITRLGTLSLYSAGYWAFSWCFAAASLYALRRFLHLRAARHRVNAFAWWHSLCVTGACLLVLGYLGWYGMIGLRTWAY